MKAEVLRHLARFDDAQRLLARVRDPEFRDAAARFVALFRAKETALKEL